MTSIQIPELLLDAAKIFVEELETHLDYFEQIRAEAAAGGSPDEVLRAHAESLGRRFHLIKGGAGFLGLEGMREAATEGDALFKGKIPDIKLTTELLDWYTILVKTMRDEHQQLKNLLCEEQDQ